jgi:flagellar hook-length control protein FliK
MSNLDALLQSISRRLETQTTKSTARSFEIGDTLTGETGAPAFDAMLRTLTGRGEAGQLQVQSKPPLLEAGATLQSAGAIRNTFQDTTEEEGDPAANSNAHRAEAADVQSPQIEAVQLQQVLSMHQGGPVLQIVTSVQVQPAPKASTVLLDMIRSPTDEVKDADALRSPAARSGQKALVLHQETHFKPVLPGMAQDGAKPPTNSLQHGIPSAEAGSGTAPFLELNSEPATQEDAKVADPQKSRDGLVRAASANSDNNPADASQSNAILQRIAGAIAAEAERSVPETSPHTRGSEFSVPTTIKPSEGALRILDIQLHPAELGVVTVRIRLNGDKLEMELQASRDDTAELLKKDSEKLAGLLRASGYRPDVVAIHSGGLNTHHQDGSFGPRQAATSHAGSQFGGSHGGDAGQGQPRRDADEAGYAGYGGR